MSMKKMTARYPGTCRKCGGKFPAGTEIMWGGGVTEHAACPSTQQPLVGIVAGGTGTAHRGQGKKTNQKSGSCDSCGEFLKPGQGELVYCVEDSGCLKHHDFSGWHVYCLDQAACKANKEAAKVARQKAAEEAKIKAAEKKAAEEAESNAYKTARDGVASGLVSVTCDMPDPSKLVLVREVARNNTGYYKMALAEYTYGGVTIYREEANGHDDWRTYWLVPPAIAKEACLAYAAKVGITVEKARDWMSKYSGCAGAEIYQAVLDAEVQNPSTPA